VTISSQYSYVLQKTQDPVLKAVYNRHIAPYKSSFPEKALDALNLACKSRNYAAIEEKDFSSYYTDGVACSLQEVQQAFVEYKASMIIQKKSRYLGIFKHT
jgi:hypothetical protein